MLQVTWEWLGQGPALDLADTVNIVEGAENDLIGEDDEYLRWAEEESRFLPEDSLSALVAGRAEILELRTPLRQVLDAITAGGKPPRATVRALNQVSGLAPSWIELDGQRLTISDQSPASAVDRLRSLYARSAIELVASKGPDLRRCPAPSCGMFYVRSRPQQTWCSTQCGTRARVARHYKKHHLPV